MSRVTTEREPGERPPEEVKQLHERGLSTQERTYVGRRPRTSYAITAAGRRELKRRLATPPRPTNLECEPLLRVLLANLSTTAQLLAAVEQIRADANAVLDVGRAVSVEYLAGTAPFQDDVHARALVFDFLSHHAITLLEWADCAQNAIAAWPDMTDADRERAALETITASLAEYPRPS